MASVVKKPLPQSLSNYITFIKEMTDYIRALQQFVSELLPKLDEIKRTLLEKKSAVEELQKYLKPRKSKNKFKAKTFRSSRARKGPMEDLKQLGLSMFAAIQMKRRSEFLIRRILGLIGTWSSPGIVTDLLNNS
ncbi:hypothetical protein HNY73_007311 [Argiope bruennichi]|uniref:Uncharacterized protein n=1 Tax=Argiope bruennichi TaxID=94029 RepID=A0A8T0FEI6_ARGBR|nr:hypothetical protein HNY73_007311 [Argiope bruennichi]